MEGTYCGAPIRTLRERPSRRGVGEPCGGRDSMFRSVASHKRSCLRRRLTSELNLPGHARCKSARRDGGERGRPPHDNSAELLSESLGACRGRIKGRSCVDGQERALRLLNGAALHRTERRRETTWGHRVTLATFARRGQHLRPRLLETLTFVLQPSRRPALTSRVGAGKRQQEHRSCRRSCLSRRGGWWIYFCHALGPCPRTVP